MTSKHETPEEIARKIDDKLREIPVSGDPETRREIREQRLAILTAALRQEREQLEEARKVIAEAQVAISFYESPRWVVSQCMISKPDADAFSASFSRLRAAKETAERFLATPTQAGTPTSEGT